MWRPSSVQAATGYHRKHAIRLLMHAKPCAAAASRPARLPVYDAAVREALIVLWAASDRICGKRLKPLLPMLVSALAVSLPSVTTSRTFLSVNAGSSSVFLNAIETPHQ